MDVVWPPDDQQARLLAQLTTLIERGGAGHLLDGAVARSDDEDFPEPWRPTAVALARVIYRVLWLAHVDLDVALDDGRTADDDAAMLRQSDLTWTETVDGTAHFAVDAIGNDNVAGLVCHEVGRAYAAWLTQGQPYRDEPAEPPSAALGSVAAVYLGLGVVATNAALYERVAGKIVGQMTVTERDQVAAGGLSPAELVYLLAVQATLRDAPIAAHATLRPELRAHLETMTLALVPHRDALAARLGVDLAAPRTALARDLAPTLVADDAYPEPEHRLRHAHLRTYRVRHVPWRAGVVLGAFAGVGAAMAAALVLQQYTTGPVLAWCSAIGALFGGVRGALRGADRCARCVTVLPLAVDTCGGCGGRIAGRLAHAGHLHRRELELDEPDEPAQV